MGSSWFPYIGQGMKRYPFPSGLSSGSWGRAVWFSLALAVLPKHLGTYGVKLCVCLGGCFLVLVFA